MADEGDLFEGLRLGSSRAFQALLHDHDPTMRRLARLYVPQPEVAALVRRTWRVALPGLDMFTWHTTLRAWLVGILVTYGRAAAAGHRAGGPDVAATAPPVPAPPSAAPLAGTDQAATATGDPTPWATLAWSDHWGTDSWRVLEDALAQQSLACREVLWLRDVEGWPWREVLDACGVTEAQGSELLRLGRTALALLVAAHVGAGPARTGTELEQRLDGVAALLGALRPRQPDPTLDPGLGRVFATWRRRRRARRWRRWRWDLARTVRPTR